MTDAEKKHIATTFIAGLRARDAGMLDAIMAKDVIWSIPGSCLVSGAAHGVKGIVERAGHFAAYSLNIEILYVLFGYTGMALSLHNTGTHNGKTLDEHLTTVIQLEGDRIKRLDTYISDVEMLNAYFV
ncbi:MAG: nuclear transport factor 2 family protein [Acetobacteraceae bacterium]